MSLSLDGSRDLQHLLTNPTSVQQSCHQMQGRKRQGPEQTEVQPTQVFP